LVVIVTYECNKTCEYCSAIRYKEYQYRELDTEVLIELKQIFTGLNKILPNEKYYISGGEPGLLDIDLYQRLFRIIPNNIIVNTNGLFIDRCYHKKLSKYNISYDIHITDEYSDYPFLKNASYNYLVHKDNYQNLGLLAKRYKHLDINVDIYSRLLLSDIDNSLQLSVDDLLEISRICNSYSNLILPQHKLNASILQHKISKNDCTSSERINLCRQVPLNFEINIPINKLYHCHIAARNMHGLDIAYNNFRKLYVEKSIDCLPLDFCYSCTTINGELRTSMISNMLKVMTKCKLL
jgi:uncharacterized Fe-S cluster-containing radical SAM superfamily protein